MGTNNCFGYGKSGRIVKHCPMGNIHGRESKQAQASGLKSDSAKRNLFHALNSRVIRRVLLMLLPICLKYFQLMFVPCCMPVQLYIF